MSKSHLLIGIALNCLLTACGGDPEVAAKKATEKLASEWTQANEIRDPLLRLQKYEAVQSGIKSAGKKYKKTQLGEKLLAGQSVGNLDPERVETEINRLARRAACYAAPSVKCLTSLSNRTLNERNRTRNTPTADSRETGAQRARRKICTEGFDAVRSELDYLSVNKQQLANEFVQLGFAAVDCNRLDDTAAAIEAAIAAKPGEEPERASFILQLMNTAEFRHVWSGLVVKLEDGLAENAYDANLAASVVLKLATYYAEEGDVEASVAKVDYLQDTLNFRLPDGTDKMLASRYLLDGSSAAAETVTSSFLKKPIFFLQALEDAIGALVQFDADGQIPTQRSHLGLVRLDSTYESLLPNLDEATAQTLLKRAVFLEEQLDKVYKRTLKEENHNRRFGWHYANLAAVYVRLGDQAKADRALEKISRASWRGVAIEKQKTDYAKNAPSRSATVRFLMALREKNFDAFLSDKYITDLAKVSQNILLEEIAKTGDAERALTMATELGLQGKIVGSQYELIVLTLSDSGFESEALRVLAAMPKAGLSFQNAAWHVVDQRLAHRQFDGAETLVRDYKLVENLGGWEERGWLERKAKALIAAGHKEAAKKALDEAFALALNEQGKWSDDDVIRGRPEAPENIAEIAYGAGYAQLGEQYFLKGKIKSPHPLKTALRSAKSQSDLTHVLMLGHDYLGHNEMSALVDSAIDHLTDS